MVPGPAPVRFAVRVKVRRDQVSIRRASVPKFTYSPGGFFLLASSRSFLGATLKIQGGPWRKESDGKEDKEGVIMFTEFLLHARFSARGIRCIISAKPQNVPEVCWAPFYHQTDGATEAHRREGTCPWLSSLSTVFGPSRSCRLQSPVVPKLSQEGAKPQAATESGAG